MAKIGGAKSRLKGKAGERGLAVIYQTVFGGSWQRVIGSGAFTGGKNMHRRATLSETQIKARSGDIHTPDFLPNLTLESKFYAEFPYHLLLTPVPVPLLDQWIEQTKEGAGPTDLWLLNWKVNRKAWNVVFPAERSEFSLTNHCLYIAADGNRFIITDLIAFLTANHDVILRLAGGTVCA
jgi:hypothetical protein